MGNIDPATERRIGTKMEFKKYRNDGLNKYMRHIVKVMDNLKNHPEKY